MKKYANTRKKWSDINSQCNTLLDMIGVIFSYTNINSVWIDDNTNPNNCLIIYTDAVDDYLKPINFYLRLEDIESTYDYVINMRIPGTSLKGDNLNGKVKLKQHNAVISSMENDDRRRFMWEFQHISKYNSLEKTSILVAQKNRIVKKLRKREKPRYFWRVPHSFSGKWDSFWQIKRW